MSEKDNQEKQVEIPYPPEGYDEREDGPWRSEPPDDYDEEELGPYVIGWSPEQCPLSSSHVAPFYCRYCGDCEHGYDRQCPNDDGQHMGQWEWRRDRRRLVIGVWDHAQCFDHWNWPCVVCYPTRSGADTCVLQGEDLLERY